MTGCSDITYAAFDVDTSYYIFEYQPGKTLSYWNPVNNSVTASPRTIRYYENGNLIKIETYSSGADPEIVQTTTYTYSTNQNKQYDAEKGMTIMNFTPPNKYLPASFTSIDDNSTIKFTYSYTTNSNGYVTEISTNMSQVATSPAVIPYNYVTKTVLGYTCN